MTLLFVGGDFTHRNEIKFIKQFYDDQIWCNVTDDVPAEILAKADVLLLKNGFSFTRSTGKWQDYSNNDRKVPRHDPQAIDWVPSMEQQWQDREKAEINKQLITLREFTETMVKKEKKEKIPFKYDEERLLKEFSDYVGSTYGKHYVGEDNVQSLDLIFATGHGEGFCCGNILKYGARQGKKANQQRDDIMKTLHYGLLLLYWYDKQEAKKDA
jgi:hypothetical protein